MLPVLPKWLDTAVPWSMARQGLRGLAGGCCLPGAPQGAGTGWWAQAAGCRRPRRGDGQREHAARLVRALPPPPQRTMRGALGQGGGQRVSGGARGCRIWGGSLGGPASPGEETSSVPQAPPANTVTMHCAVTPPWRLAARHGPLCCPPGHCPPIADKVPGDGSPP